MTSDRFAGAQQQQPHPAVSRGSWRDAVRLVAWCLVCLVAPLIVLPRTDLMVGDAQASGQPAGWKEKRRMGLDEADVEGTIDQLREERPDYICIGNSMLYTRLGVTPEMITGVTGRKFYLIWKGGTFAPEWFLFMKNVVAASGARPKAICLFVRDDDLTRPCVRKAGKAQYLRSLSTRHEPELDRYMNTTSPEADDVGWLDALYSFPAWREKLSHKLTDAALDLGGLGMPKNSQRSALAARFGLDHLRGDVPSDMPAAEDDEPEEDSGDDRAGDIPRPRRVGMAVNNLDQVIQASLLPDMLRIAESCGTRLMVFRVKRRPDAQTHLPIEPQAMRTYSDLLGRWLKDHGAVYYDESYDTSIRLSDYLDGDHLRPDRREWYCQYFWERMRELFP